MSRVEWLKVEDIDADALLNPAPKQSDKLLASNSARGDATRFLFDILKDGPVRSNEVKRAADEAGIDESTLKRAKKDSLVTSSKLNNIWHWALPERGTGANKDDAENQEDHDDPLVNLDTLDTLDTLTSQEGQEGQEFSEYQLDPLEDKDGADMPSTSTRGTF